MGRDPLTAGSEQEPEKLKREGKVKEALSRDPASLSLTFPLPRGRGRVCSGVTPLSAANSICIKMSVFQLIRIVCFI